MTGRLADIETRIKSVHKLSTVISAMRGIAASRAQEARKHVESIRVFAQTIGNAIGQAMTLLPDAMPAQGPHTGHRAVILLTAEQGFAGAYSEQIFDAAGDVLQGPCEIFIAGDRGLRVAEERGLSVGWSAPMISHPSQATTLATRLTEAIYETLTGAGVTQVLVVHAVPGGMGGLQVVSRQLIPFDYARFPPPAHGGTPELTLPPETLLARLAEEYVFADLSEAVMLSFAAENDARMRAMIAAHDNVSASLHRLVATSRRLRQEDITEEIVELATGSLPLQ